MVNNLSLWGHSGSRVTKGIQYNVFSDSVLYLAAFLPHLAVAHANEIVLCLLFLPFVLAVVRQLCVWLRTTTRKLKDHSFLSPNSLQTHVWSLDGSLMILQSTEQVLWFCRPSGGRERQKEVSSLSLVIQNFSRHELKKSGCGSAHELSPTEIEGWAVSKMGRALWGA